MSHQTDLLALFTQTQRALDDFVASRSAEERAARGTPQVWEAKDLLALIGFWMIYNVDRLNIYARGDTPPRQVDFSALNREVFEASAGRSWDEVAHATLAALAALTQTVQQATDDLLTTVNIYEDIPLTSPGKRCAPMASSGRCKNWKNTICAQAKQSERQQSEPCLSPS